MKVQLTTRISILAVFDTYIHWLPSHLWFPMETYWVKRMCSQKLFSCCFSFQKKKVSTLKLFKLILHKISLDMIIQNDYQMIWFNPLILVLKYKIFQLLFICVKFQHIFLFWIIFLFAILTLLFMRFKNWSYIHICSDQRPIASALGPRRTITWKISFSRISRSPCDGKITWEKLFSFKNSLLMNF